MSNRMPSLLALLGLAAAAGYQNRDALKRMLAQPDALPADAGAVPRTDGSGWLDDLIGRAKQALDGNAGGPVDMIRNGLGELVDRFRDAGQPDVAESWVATGQNRSVTPDEIRTAVGPDLVAQLSQKTGMSEVDLLARLAQTLPGAVDRLTPAGRLPDANDADALIRAY